MAIYMYKDTGPLCFTANTANSTVELTKVGYPTSVSLQVSTNGNSWSNYIPGSGTTIQLQNVGDKIYFRNTSETDTGFSIKGTGYYYKFVMNGNIAASGDVTTLLNKNGTDTITVGCFINLFMECSALTIPPIIPATTLGEESLYGMFYNCSNLEVLPKIYATSLGRNCMMRMFSYDTKIKLSTTKTGNYQTEYRIPYSGTGVEVGTTPTNEMFYKTGGTFTSDPTINTTYYTSNDVI